MSDYHKPTISESTAYTICMITEWIGEVERLAQYRARERLGPAVVSEHKIIDEGWELLSEEYPYLVDVQEGEGIMGLRRIAIEMAPVIDKAFDMLGDDGETLIHGWPASEGTPYESWAGMGDYDFEVVPFCVKHWLFLQATAIKLGGSGEVKVSVAQMHSYLADKLAVERSAHAT
jgi:hypothetical protein